MQLFGSTGSDIAWPLEFEKFLTERLPLLIDQFAGLPQYRVENYRYLPVQDEFRSYLVNRLSLSTRSWSMRMVSPCLEKRFLPLLSTVKLAPKDQRVRIVQNLRDELHNGLVVKASKERLSKIAFVPGCFGFIDPDQLAQPVLRASSLSIAGRWHRRYCGDDQASRQRFKVERRA